MSELIEKIPEEKEIISVPEEKNKRVITSEDTPKKFGYNPIQPKARDIFKGQGIVTDTETVKRIPRGEGKIGYTEEIVPAPMAGLTNRVPVGEDKYGQPIYGTLEESGTVDIARQKQPMSYEDFKEKVFSGEITQASPAGSPYVLKVLSDLLKNDNVNPKVKVLKEAQLRTFYNYSQYKDPSQRVIRPFGEEGKFKYEESDNRRLASSKKAFFDNQTDFLKVIQGRFTQFQNPKDQTLIEQKLLNRISLGNTPRSALRVAIERFNEIPRAIPTLIPYTKYVYDYLATGAALNPDVWEATRKDREEMVQMMKEALSSELGIPLLMDVMNESIVDELKLDLKNKKITEEKFKELTQIK